MSHHLLQAYLNDQKGRLADTTLDSYRMVLSHFPSLPLTLSEARMWKTRRLTEVSASSVATELRALKSFDRWYAEEMDEAPQLAKLPFPKVTVPVEAPVVTEDEYQAMLAACDKSFMGMRDAAIIAVLWSTGMRRSEVARLQVDDVDLAEGTVVVRKTKNGTPRTAYLTPEARTRLRRYMLKHGNDIGPLWRGYRGYAVTPELIAVAVERRAKEAGVNVTCHQFRRALAMRWLQMGGSETLLREVAGWNSPTMVSRYVRAVRSELALGEAQRLFG